MDLLARDPRTQWAAWLHRSFDHHPEISEQTAALLADRLGEHEPAEAIVRARLGPPRWGGDAFDAGPTLIAMRTPFSWHLVDEATGTVTSLDAVRAPSGHLPAAMPVPDRAKVFRLADSALQVFTPDSRVESAVTGRAGELIKRLPEFPGVPPMPLDLLGGQASPTDASLPGGVPAEEVVLRHRAVLGLPVLTVGGHHDGVGQAALHTSRVGVGTLQDLIEAGTPVHHRVVYSAAGYTGQALEYAQERAISLFEVTPRGALGPVNTHAGAVAETAAAHDTPDWVIANAYVTEVEQRVRAHLNDDLRTLRSRRRFRPLPGHVLAGLDSYRVAAARGIERRSAFGSPSEAIIHFHHTELLAAAPRVLLGLRYP